MGRIHLIFTPTPAWVLILFGTVMFFGLGVLFEDSRQSNDYRNLLIGLGVFGTWVTLIANNLLSANNARKQHTINFLFNTRFNNTIYQEQILAFRERFPDGEAPTFDEFMTLRNSGCDKDKKAFTAANYLLNYYEFLGVGVQTKDLDEELLVNTVRGQLLRLSDQLEHVVEGYRKDDVTNHYGQKTLEHYCLLLDRWGNTNGE